MLVVCYLYRQNNSNSATLSNVFCVGDEERIQDCGLICFKGGVTCSCTEIVSITCDGK